MLTCRIVTMGRSGTESASTDSDGNESLPDVGISIGSRLRHRKAGSNDVKGSGVQVNGSNEKLQFTWSSNWPMPASSSKCIFPGCTSFMTEYYRSKTGSPLCHKHEAMMRATSRRGLFHSFSDQQLHSAQTIGQSQHTSPQRPRPSENGHLNDGDYESPSRYPLDSPRKKVPNRPASSGLILLRRGSTPRSIRHGSPAMRATSQQGSPLKSGVTHRHSTSELKGNGALSAIRSPTLSPSISSEDRLDQQRSTGKLQFDTCSRAYHDQDKARAWMNAGCSPKLPPTDQEEPPARRTYNPGVRRGMTVETEAASISKSGPLEDCQDVESKLSDFFYPAPLMAFRCSYVFSERRTAVSVCPRKFISDTSERTGGNTAAIQVAQIRGTRLPAAGHKAAATSRE